MASHRLCILQRFVSSLAWLLLIFGLVPALSARAAAEERTALSERSLAAVLDKPAPENVEDLKAIEVQVQAVLQKVLPCTVGVRVGGSWGSGVIVREEGYVLTAGHVSSQPDREVTLILMDGRQVKGKTLGANHRIDSGLIKITEEGTWPFT